jgi:hypothetical protein
MMNWKGCGRKHCHAQAAAVSGNFSTSTGQSEEPVRRELLLPRRRPNSSSSLHAELLEYNAYALGTLFRGATHA